MSLHFLGIRDFAISARAPPPPAPKPAPPPSASELIQDSKDVLIQRLLDLATHLQDQDLRDEDLSTLHHDVSHMERTWHQSPALPQSPGPGPLFHPFRAPDTPRSQTPDHDDRRWTPLSPGLRSPIRLFDSRSPSVSLPSRPTTARALSPTKAALLASEADSLLSHLTHTVSELRARREESEHIHDLLVTRAEKAARRVLELEERIADLDADFETTQSELHFLRVQLRALEVQGLERGDEGDEELRRSIGYWKSQWMEVDRRARERRGRGRGGEGA